MDTPDRKILPRKLNKRKKTNEKRYHPTKKTHICFAHSHLLVTFVGRHVLGRRGHLTLPLLMSPSFPRLC